MVAEKKRRDEQSEEQTRDRDREISRNDRLMNEVNKGGRDETEMSHDQFKLNPLATVLLVDSAALSCCRNISLPQVILEFLLKVVFKLQI